MEYPIDIHCKECGKKLAVKTSSMITEIKYKTMLVKVENGKTSIKCGRCGTTMEIECSGELIVGGDNKIINVPS